MKNKYFYLIITIIFMVLVYTHSKTFLANDDLPYMFLYRTDVRVDSLLDVIKNQCADYFNINGRVVVHSVLQTILMFDKTLWTVLNPIMIILGIVFLIKIVNLNNKKTNKILSLLLGISLYLLLINFKQIIYWVAGSVNYVWVFTLLISLVYLHHKYGFHKNKYINMLIIFILCLLHECTMVFTIVYVLGNMIIDWCQFKKFNKDYIFYIIGFLGSLVLLLSPANQNRLVSDEVWNSLNIIEKLLTSIPIVSKNILNLTNYKMSLSYIYILSISILLIKNKDKFSIVNLILIILNMILIYILKNNWLYLTLVLLLVTGEIYTCIKNKQYKNIILCLSIYAVVYFNIISPTHASGRPNYYFYMYIILISISLLNETIKNKNIKKILFIILPLITISLLSYEIYIYKTIGNYHQERIEEINTYKESNSKDTLYLTEIPSKYGDYHMDINLPDKDWFNYQSFINYYNLPKDIEIKYIKK
ncbi:MAG: hypothetical protein IJE89_04945 [Bacilli bacterium]|nr:hypothetical protein [Bacilli bacterium]